MICEEINHYLSSSNGLSALPFFYTVGDDEYLSTLSSLKEMGLKVIRTSDLCYKEDKYPSIDDLVDLFRTTDVDYRSNRFVVVGLGEYFALRGALFAERELARLKYTSLGTSRVVLLLRGVGAQVDNVVSIDNRIFEQNRIHLSESSVSHISICNVFTADVNGIMIGMKSLLRAFEDGATGQLMVHTNLVLSNSLFAVSMVEDAYALICIREKEFALAREAGTDEYWTKLLKDYSRFNQSFAALFNKHSFSFELTTFYNRVNGLSYENWLYFVFLKMNACTITNTYLREVINATSSFGDFKNNVLTYIIHFRHNDNGFDELYRDRKALVRDFDDADISSFIRQNEVDPKEAIYRYTDNTISERKAILSWISKHGMVDQLDTIYPDLAAYLGRYRFYSTSINDELTEYFELYKKQKVENHVLPSFLELVQKYAQSYLYAKLPTRDSIISAIDDKKHTHLLWIDALGVEYIAYIVELAKKRGLSLKIEIARSYLPTITSINKTFYDQWDGQSKIKEERLDSIKHKEGGGYYFTKCEEPIHLAAELEVINDAIAYVTKLLSQRDCKKVVIASDHGASRLAVIHKQEIHYPSDTKGQHSGRCCAYFEDCKSSNCIAENGYLVVSDYGRFEGSRAANVEVHGGASLEEIVVPIISITLRNQLDVEIIVIDKENIIANRDGVLLQLYISDVEQKDNVSLIINDKRYYANREDETHFSFCLVDIKRAKTYTAEVFDGDDIIGNITFTVKGKLGNRNDDFDDLF